MNPIIRNVIAVVGGIAFGSIINMGLITLSPHVIPPPEGMDPMNAESIREAIKLMTPKHFIFPFLAHALGTLAGSLIAAKFAQSRHFLCALVVGVFFLFGGIVASIQIGAPAWYVALDLAGAYLPMAWLGYKWSRK